MANQENDVVPGAPRVLVVKCADGSISYCFEGLEPGWEVPVNLASLSPAELRAIADHKEALLQRGFKNFC